MDPHGFLCSYNVCGIYQVTHLLGGGSSGTPLSSLVAACYYSSIVPLLLPRVHQAYMETLYHINVITGDVVRAFNTLTGEDVAIKLSRRPSDESIVQTSVKYEISVYKLIPDGIPGFPSVHYAGPDANHNVIVMDFLGPSLDALRRTCRGTFTLRTVCMLADQMVW